MLDEVAAELTGVASGAVLVPPGNWLRKELLENVTDSSDSVLASPASTGSWLATNSVISHKWKRKAENDALDSAIDSL